VLFLIVFIYVVGFLFSCAFSLLTAWLAYRSRFSRWLAWGSVVLGGVSGVVSVGFLTQMKALSAFSILGGVGVAVGLLVGIRLPGFHREDPV